MSGFAFKGFNLGVRNDIDVKVPADLDQLGRDNSHGTIICWKGLIQLCH